MIKGVHSGEDSDRRINLLVVSYSMARSACVKIAAL